MKAGIHPEYRQVQVRCSCGNQFELGSALNQENMRVEVCNKCHPFYTGKQKIIDTAGRVDSFYRKFGKFGKTVEPETAADSSASEKNK